MVVKFVMWLKSINKNSFELPLSGFRGKDNVTTY